MWNRSRKGASLERYVLYVVGERGLSSETGLTYERLLRSGAKKLDKEVWDITVADARSLMARSDLSWRWKSGFASAWKGYRSWGELEGLWEMNGSQALKPPKRQFAEDKAPVSDETARRFLEAARTSAEVRIVRLPLFQGLRLQEATLVDSWTEKMKVMGKGGKIRVLPVHPEVDRYKALILERQPASKSTLRTAFIRLQKRLDAKDLDGLPATPHSLRHTYSTHLTGKRVNPDHLDELMGHSRGTRGVYSQIPFEFLKEAGEMVDYSPIRLYDYYASEPVQTELFG